MYILRKRARKLKTNIFLKLYYYLHNFALKLETSWAKRVVQLIPETRNTNDISMFGLFILG